MTCSSLCSPECGVARTSPVTATCNEPCVRQCPDSQVIIYPSPVAVTMAGPTMSTWPQYSEVGAEGAPVLFPGAGGSFGFGGSYGGYNGLGRFGIGHGYGYGRAGGYGGYLGGGYGGICGSGVSCHGYGSANCGPC